LTPHPANSGFRKHDCQFAYPAKNLYKMSWNDIFPVLEIQNSDIAQASAAAEIFKISSIINSKESFHIAVTSLYCGERCAFNPTGDTAEEHSELMTRHLGCWGRSNWRNIEFGARDLKQNSIDVTIRVYLDRHLKCLIPALLRLDCEIYLMDKSSRGCCAGSMWRYLALEESSKVFTIVDADNFRSVRQQVNRTIATTDVTMHAWRIPRISSETFSYEAPKKYRPVKSTCFGSSGGYPVIQLLDAAIKAQESNDAPTTDKSSSLVNGPKELRWPRNEFDEWFLLMAIYPRMAQRGMLTFIPEVDAPFCSLLLLDIVYATWANSNSEIIFVPRDKAGQRERLFQKQNTEVIARPDCEFICRSRSTPNISRREGSIPLSLPLAITLAGDSISSIKFASRNVQSTWWADLDPHLKAASSKVELFLDERLAHVDLAVCSWFFIRLDEAAGQWAISKGGQPEHWRPRMIKKVPNLNAPMNFWRSSSATDFYREWNGDSASVQFEIYLALKIELGECSITEFSLKDQGWCI
jgi:hypothetical protein